MKNAARASLSSAWLTPLWSWSTRGRVCIFAFHHFAGDTPTRRPAVPVKMLDEILTRLRRDGYRLVALDDAVRSIGDPAFRESRSVAFTVDDGYADFHRSAEVFRQHGCPVTMFLTTGFIDGRNWLWWDQIEYVCLRASAGRFRPCVEGPEVVLVNGGDRSRIEVAQRLWVECKLLRDDDKQRFISAFGEAAGVKLPSEPPEQYRPLTWEQIRALEGAGVRFAPHTVTHPVLSQLDDVRAAWEISESWRRVCEELDDPMPVLAYPNGQPGDYGERERRIAAEAGLIAAVTAVPDHAALPHGGAADGRERLFSLPRFSAPLDPHDACLAASGFYGVLKSLRRVKLALS